MMGNTQHRGKKRKKRLRGCNFKKYTNKTQHHRKNHKKKCEETFLNSAYNMRKILKNQCKHVCVCVYFFIILVYFFPCCSIFTLFIYGLTLHFYAATSVLVHPFFHHHHYQSFLNAKKGFRNNNVNTWKLCFFLCPTPP